MNEIKNVSLDLIDDPMLAMRSDVDADNIEELMSDMQKVGLIEPIVVRPTGARFEVIAGHRRSRAARLLGWPTIEAKIVEADDDKALQMRLIENLSRHDVDPVDEASFIGEIILKYHYTIEQIAEKMHRSLQWVKDRMEVFELPDYIKHHLKLKKYPLGAALWLGRIKNENAKIAHANWAAVNGVSVLGAKCWHDMILSSTANFNFQNIEIKDEGGQVQRVRSVIPCSACGKDVFLDEADSVFVHKSLKCPLDTSLV